MASVPKFIRFFWPILKALRELGGSAKPREVVDLVIEMLGVSSTSVPRSRRSMVVSSLSFEASARK